MNAAGREDCRNISVIITKGIGPGRKADVYLEIQRQFSPSDPKLHCSFQQQAPVSELLELETPNKPNKGVNKNHNGATERLC